MFIACPPFLLLDVLLIIVLLSLTFSSIGVFTFSSIGYAQIRKYLFKISLVLSVGQLSTNCLSLISTKLDGMDSCNLTPSISRPLCKVFP
nr:MAG TPA_asm: hypothetical protein [Caudoviricetes sp.]